jgi:hypothetical protein
VTPVVVWFYINILYFPYNAQDLAKVPFEDFARPIFESLEIVDDTTRPAPEQNQVMGYPSPAKEDQPNPLS